MRPIIYCLFALPYSFACSDAGTDSNPAVIPSVMGGAGGIQSQGGAGGAQPPAPVAGQGGSAMGQGGAVGGGGMGGASPEGGTTTVGGEGSMAQAGEGGTGGMPEEMSPGHALYVQHCQLCHGEDAKGVTDPASGKPLGVDARHPVEDYAIWLVRNGSTPRMTNDTYLAPMLPIQPDTLSDADLALILAYLSDRTMFPQPTTGEELYMDYCSACHASDGGGVPTGRPLAEVERADIPEDVRQGHHPGEYENAGEFMPPRDEEEISDAELELIVDYIDQTF